MSSKKNFTFTFSQKISSRASQGLLNPETRTWAYVGTARYVCQRELLPCLCGFCTSTVHLEHEIKIFLEYRFSSPLTWSLQKRKKCLKTLWMLDVLFLLFPMFMDPIILCKCSETRSKSPWSKPEWSIFKMHRHTSLYPPAFLSTEVKLSAKKCYLILCIANLQCV